MDYQTVCVARNDDLSCLRNEHQKDKARIRGPSHFLRGKCGTLRNLRALFECRYTADYRAAIIEAIHHPRSRAGCAGKRTADSSL